MDLNGAAVVVSIPSRNTEWSCGAGTKLRAVNTERSRGGGLWTCGERPVGCGGFTFTKRRGSEVLAFGLRVV